jgi:branched-chain amino acid transport system ATP-binding protein
MAESVVPVANMQNVMVGVHSRTRSDFLSNALALPWVGREERQTRRTADELTAA